MNKIAPLTLTVFNLPEGRVEMPIPAAEAIIAVHKLDLSPMILPTSTLPVGSAGHVIETDMRALKEAGISNVLQIKIQSAHGIRSVLAPTSEEVKLPKLKTLSL